MAGYYRGMRSLHYEIDFSCTQLSDDELADLFIRQRLRDEADRKQEEKRFASRIKSCWPM